MNHSIAFCVLVCAATFPNGVVHGQCDFEVLVPTYWHQADWDEGSQREISCDGQTLAFGCAGRDGWNPVHELPAIMTFQHDGSEWTDEQFILEPNDNPESGFGLGLVVSGDRMVVSAPDQDVEDELNVGRLYVYGRMNGF